MVKHNEHSIKFLQLTDLLHVLQVTLAENRPGKFVCLFFSKKKKKETRQKDRKEENLMTRLVKALLPPIR